MKTYILASIFTDKKSLEEFKNNDGNQGINWVPGAPTIRYRESGTNKEFPSSADTRWDNFPEPIWNLLYKNNHRYYTESLGNRIIADKYTVTRIQVLLAEKNICSSNEIPGLVVLEVEVPKEEIGKEFKIKIGKVYQYLAENHFIPGFKIGDKEAEEYKDESESRKLQKSMWKKNIKPSMYVVNIVNSLKSIDSSFLKNFRNLKKDNSDRLEFIKKLHEIADRREPSDAAREKWTEEDPKGLQLEGDSEYRWCFYARSNGMVYYFPDSKINGSDLPICFQGYAESFHMDAIMLSILKNILVNYCTGQIQKFVSAEDKKEIKNINNAINRMYIMYDMGRTNPRGGKHVIAMEKVESALYFEQNLNVLKDSVEKIEGINSMQRQEDLAISQEELARYALLVAVVMVIPGFVSVVNDGISSIVNYPWTLIIYLFVVVIIFCYIWRNPDEIKNIKAKIRSANKIDREDHNK
ncbi:hypothetical protein [Rothia mucilaginosa]|uniref:hypothetical protein n=1 Tax=Rothia mucilaginosa TaxID=43675 RepID=UPI0028EA2856|nr:hypothetical protein [Rothia mucilaginosa]